MKTNLTGELTSSLLAPGLRARFFELFGVASRKSVFAWREAVLPQAQVVVLDVSSDLSRLQFRPPCVIWVGALPAGASVGAWSGRLAPDYTVADLIDILDRAAVFLLDWKARRPAPAAEPRARTLADSGMLQPAASPAMAAAPGTRYRLEAWIVLGAPFDGAGCVSALALLARQPVTAQQLQQHSGLPPAMVVDLLQELARRKVLQASVSAPPATAAPQAHRGGATVHQGLVRRLSHWLKGASRP